jgi:transcriptional regulator with XRE-family HTH domain
MGLGEVFRERRAALGLTLDDVAERSGVARAAINSVELGHTRMPREAEARRRVAKVLGIRHWEMLVAAGVIEKDELPGGKRATQTSELEDLLAELPPEVRLNTMESIRLAVRAYRRMRAITSTEAAAPERTPGQPALTL